MIWDDQTPNSHDLDALCQLFPASSPNFADYLHTQSLTAFGMQEYGSLQDFMVTYMAALNGEYPDNGND